MIKALHEMNTQIHDFRVVESAGRTREGAEGDEWPDPRQQVDGCLQPESPRAPLGVYEQGVLQRRHRRVVAGRDRAGRRRQLREQLPAFFPARRTASATPIRSSPARRPTKASAGRSPHKRVVILTRSAFPGMQRYAAAAWSGDINGDWETFKPPDSRRTEFLPDRACRIGPPTPAASSVRAINTLRRITTNCSTRWFQWSTFCPILRIHGYQTETEMWKWLPETQNDPARVRHAALPDAALQLFRRVEGHAAKATR